MPNYRRWYVPGGTYFFTIVTHQRQRLFGDAAAATLLGQIMRSHCEIAPYKTIAAVLLPDHLHVVWALPSGDDDYSSRWQHIKRDFSAQWLAAGGEERPVSEAQSKRGSRGIWQRRFFERSIRDEDELANVVDYIHYNPVNHGLVASPADCPHSTFQRFVCAGEYEAGWGRSSVEVELGFECE